MAERTPMQVAKRLRDETNAFDRRNRARYDDWASLRSAIIEAITALEAVGWRPEPGSGPGEEQPA